MKNGYSPVEGKDYEISGTTSSSEDGTYTITIKGKGKYTGQVDLEWRIAPKQDIASINAKLDPTDFIADDTEHTPTIVWPENSKLVENVDYTISGTQSATAVGDYTITITGKGKYKGTLDLNWTISATDIATVIEGLDQDSFANDGEEHNPEVVWKDGKVLVEGKDYDLSSDTSATDEGTYTITITGKGNYDGAVSYTWTVSTVDISVALAGITPEHFDYDGKEHSPELIWAGGYSGIKDTDYSISGDLNKSDSGNYTLVVNGKGKYKGVVYFNWNIRELIPVGAVYTIYKTGEQLTGDGVSVYFPIEAGLGTSSYSSYRGDTYIDNDYTYTYMKDSRNSSEKPGWYVGVNDRSKEEYGDLRTQICGEPIERLQYFYGSSDTRCGTFYNCTKMLRSSIIPNSVTNISGAFFNCTSLIEAPLLHEHITTLYDDGINSETFRNCRSLRTYVGSDDPDGDFSKYKIPDGVTNMSRIFIDCTSMIKAPEIPNHVEFMYATFSGCTSLTEAPRIPDSVYSLQFTFSGCTSLKTYADSTDPDGDFSSYIHPPKHAFNIDHAFMNCVSMVKAPAIPDNVTDINGTFLGCTSLTGAPIIPDKVTNMKQAFYDCTSLTGTLTCNANPTSYANALEGTKITAIEGYSKTKGSLLLTTGKQYVLTEKNVSLQQDFYTYDGNTHSPIVKCSIYGNISYVRSGDTKAKDSGNYEITITGTGNCVGTVSLSWSINEKSISKAVSGIENAHFVDDGTKHSPNIIWNVGYEDLEEGRDFQVKGTRTSSDLGMYTITIEGLGSYGGCVSYDWDIGKLMPSGSIYTFSTGKQLIGDGQSVFFPNSISYRDTYTESYYKYTCLGGSWSASVNDKSKSSYGALRSYICGIYTDSVSFSGCTSMTEAPVIPDSVTDMIRTFSGCTSLVEAPVIPDSVTDMSSTFSDCTSLVEAPVIPDKVTNMSGTFSGCTFLVEAPVIPDSVTDMSSTFSGCTSLVEAPVIPDKVTNMIRTFSGCTSLVEAPVIPNSVTQMGDSIIREPGTFSGCFSGCTSLVEAPVIPNSVTNMYGTFSDCTSLTEAPVIPDSVKRMKGTFSGCTSLTDTLICNANTASWCIKALKGTKITDIEGSCNGETKTRLLQTRYAE